MIILTIRTDKPEAEIGLYNNTDQIAYETWEAHRRLAETLHRKIQELLSAHNIRLQDIEAVGAYSGPGSFTGLRIGLSVANALAASYGIPVAGATGESWIQEVTKHVLDGSATQHALVPEYGAPVHITPQRK